MKKMGRRRWRFVTIAAFLLTLKDIQCQGDNEFYYTPERNFAQVQPLIFPNSRPTTFLENGDSYRVASAGQPFYNEGHVRLPSPSYNQNPSPFQLPTGRSQSGTQYYLNQPDFSTSQRQRFRPAPPINYQLVNSAPTKRPDDISQIHSVAYQNDPSKPETFLGQITLNNPDIDSLQNGRFQNIPFTGNSLKSHGQSGHIPHDDEIDNDDQELYEHHKVTTYNPTKLVNRPSVKPSGSRFSHFDPLLPEDKRTPHNFPTPKNTVVKNFNLPKHIANSYHDTSTEYKPLLDLEPLLEDDIRDISSFRELMKNTKGSFDVEVIKSNQSKVYDDSKSDASSMGLDNIAHDSAVKTHSIEKLYTQKPPVITSSTQTVPSSSEKNDSHADTDTASQEGEEEEYDGEYYDDDEEETQTAQTTPKNTESSKEPVTDIYDEYDSTEEIEKSEESPKVNTTGSYEVLVMEPNKTMVKDDNFKGFIDTTVIDQPEQGLDNDTGEPSQKFTFSKEDKEDVSSFETPSILGEEVVSVVTTKSVVNGTISIPNVTYSPTPKSKTSHSSSSPPTHESDDGVSVTTENWIVVASVQTSRSVSGARFLPFPTVEQEEKKQVLTDEDEENVTENPKDGSRSSSSTENINDKLDTIQSELSIDVLSGSINNENKNIELITETTTDHMNASSSTTQGPVKLFTVKSTQSTTITERASPDPLPVNIKKFAPRLTTSTTPKPRKKPSLVTVMDELPSGLLPAGYKPKLSFKDKRTSTTTPSTKTTSTTITTTTPLPLPSIANVIINGTQGRSSGISSKNKVIILDDKSLLPKEYKPREKPKEIKASKIQEDDLSKFLPPGYKPPIENTDSKNNALAVEKIDISALLPKGFKLNNTKIAVDVSEIISTTSKPVKNITKIPATAVEVDINSSLLPPDFKLNNTEGTKIEIPLEKIKIADISNLLPPGFKLNNTDETIDTPTVEVTTSAPGGFKLVFPSRPGGKLTRKSTTQKPTIGPPPVTPKIQKGWPTRASTEFTGWPSPSTTPFSLEKLLELQRNATSTTPLAEINTEASTRRVISTTTTTQSPPAPTTPGVCRQECDIAATIKLVSGAKWIPELLDQHTKEWKRLAKEVKEELNSVYSKNDLLSKWYKGIRIDGFSEGSVLVDYFIELKNVEEKVDTLQIKKLFHKSLHEAKPGSVVEETPAQEFDPDAMLGDEPDEDRMRKSDEQMTKTIDKSAGKLEIGKFVMDPAYTEFIVLPKREEPTIVEPDEESLLPQWGIAVIVIALASLLFVVIFGVTVLVNRQKSAKTKQPIPLSEDMLRELDKSHMGGFDDVHPMKERDLPYLPSGKRMSTAFIEQLAYPNPGDSWRSEWTPQLQKYMQHYTPDSGRGSQIYGTGGNGYGYGGSQLYGQTGGGSQVYGYTGEFPRSHHSRRRSEYDRDF